MGPADLHHRAPNLPVPQKAVSKPSSPAEAPSTRPLRGPRDHMPLAGGRVFLPFLRMSPCSHSASAFWSLGTAVTGLVINAHGPLRVARSPSESLSRTLSRTLSRKRNVAKVALLRKVLRLHYAMGILEGMKGVQSNINMECIRQIMEGIGFKYDDDHMDASCEYTMLANKIPCVVPSFCRWAVTKLARYRPVGLGPGRE